ncbi:hypothetical protein FBULB1_2835 [Fusarium bulbicola]|nr:hypothetical protein FBULB1_2835 [Fusarium bulbicola]
MGDVESRRARMEPGIAVLADPNFPLDQVVTRDFFADTSDGQKILLRWYYSNHKSLSPAVIYAHGGVSADEHLTPFLSWNTTDNETGWQALLGCDRGGDMVTETAAPARMVDATGMPPLYIKVGELDLFRNESIELATKFYKFGTSAELHVYPGCPHGFDIFPSRGTESA